MSRLSKTFKKIIISLSGRFVFCQRNNGYSVFVGFPMAIASKEATIHFIM